MLTPSSQLATSLSVALSPSQDGSTDIESAGTDPVSATTSGDAQNSSKAVTQKSSVHQGRGGLVSLFGYALAVVITLLVLYHGLRLDCVDMSVPLQYEKDALLILPLVKATIERGSHWRNPRLGAPGEQELYDFPIVDHLHFAFIWLLGQIVDDPVKVFNLFHLLTYPLTTLTTMFVMRRFGLSLPAAAAGGILYAFQPYHYFRSVKHYFLSAYYVIPLTMMAALWVCQGKLPFVPEGADGGRRWRIWDGRGWACVVIGVATASAGAYYAFFACALLAAASFYGWARTRTWRALASGWLIIVVIGLAGVVNHAPTFGHQARTGVNAKPTMRYPEEADIYGMKVTQLLMPVANHNYKRFAALQSEYDSPRFRPGQNENCFDSLGMIGAIGLCGLLIYVFLPLPRAWPYGPLAALTLFAVLLGTIGGLGSLFNLLVTPQVRALNRICIYIAFMALFASCWTLDSAFADNRWSRFLGRCRIRLLVQICFFAGLTKFGLWDQLNVEWFKVDNTYDARDKVAEQFKEDRDFFERVEGKLPENSAVFNYPHVSYPESPNVIGVESYDHVRGYLHTRTLRWSFGAMYARRWDYHGRELMNETPPQLVMRLVLLGFHGLLIDVRGFNDLKKYAEMHNELENLIGKDKHIVNKNGTLAFYDLSEYADWLTKQSRQAFEKMAIKERERLVPMFLSGFFLHDRVWYARPKAQLVILNPSDRTRKVSIRADLAILVKDTTTLTLAGPDWRDEVELTNTNRNYQRKEIVLPPGYSTISFNCPPPASYLPSDSSYEVYTVSNFNMVEQETGVPSRTP